LDGYAEEGRAWTRCRRVRSELPGSHPPVPAGGHRRDHAAGRWRPQAVRGLRQ